MKFEQVGDSAPALAQTLSAYCAQGPVAAAEPDAEAAGVELPPAVRDLHPEAAHREAKASESAMAKAVVDFPSPGRVLVIESDRGTP